MLDYNAHSTGFKFNVKGVAIGNPLLKANRDVQAKYEYFWSHGMISDEIYLAIKNDCDFGDADSGSKSCMNDISEAEIIAADHIDHDDVILDVCDPSIVEQELRLKKMATKISINVDVCMSYERDFYFNLPEVQKVLHTNRTNLTYKWSICTLLQISEEDTKQLQDFRNRSLDDNCTLMQGAEFLQRNGEGSRGMRKEMTVTEFCYKPRIG